ncbi:MAG: hypothetical protein V4488_19335 [Pseudomonadota bacterium]
MKTQQASARLSSIDALRGLTVAAMLLVNSAGDWSHATCLLEGSGAIPVLYKALFAQPLTLRFGPYFSSMAFAVVSTGLWWGLMVWFYKHGWRITV